MSEALQIISQAYAFLTSLTFAGIHLWVLFVAVIAVSAIALLFDKFFYS